MNFTITTIAVSLANYLQAYLPGVQFLEDPAQQKTQTPAIFLQQRYSSIERQVGGYWLRKIGLDLAYLEDYNLPNLQQLYLAAAETLDLCMDSFPYSDGTTDGTVNLLTYDRTWTIDLDALHYKFEIQERVTLPPAEEVKMQTIEDYTPEVTPVNG